MKEVKILSEIKDDNIVALLAVRVSLMMELCEFDFKPFNVDKKVSSLDQFLSCIINEQDIFHSFFDFVSTVSYLYSRDFAHRNIKPTFS